jgi:cell division protein FtsB
VSQTLSFIQTHNIETLADVSSVVQNLHAEYNSMHNKVTEMSRRYHTLTEHIAQAEAYQKHAAVYAHWYKLKGEKSDAFYKKHSEKINAFTTAHKYITRHLNGRKQIPLGEWRREFSELSARRDAMLSESDKLRDDVQSAEVIKRNAYKVMGVVEPKRNRAQGMGR